MMTSTTLASPHAITAASEHIVMAALVMPVVLLTVEHAVVDTAATVLAVVGLITGVLRAQRGVRGRDSVTAGIVQRLTTLAAWVVVVVAAVAGVPTSLALTGTADVLVGILLLAMLGALIVIDVIRSGSWALDRLAARRETS